MSSQLNPSGSPVDKIDPLLRAFFRAEIPDPWPAAPATPEPTPHVVRRRGSLWRSRLALAASVARLVIGQWFLAGAFPGFPTPSAEVPAENDSAKKNVLPQDPMDMPPAPMPAPTHR
jgi:hypothetical protein